MMSSNNIDRRLPDIEARLTPVCRSCWGAAYAIVIVPEGADEESPEYCPTHCRECGIPLRCVQKIIGPSDAEVYGSTEVAG
jgi:hypothetical protein